MTHHQLLHREKIQPDRSVRPNTLHLALGRIAFKMLRLNVFNVDGEPGTSIWTMEVMKPYFEKASSDGYGSAVADIHCWGREWPKINKHIPTPSIWSYVC